MARGQLGVLHTNSAYAPAMAALPVQSEDERLRMLDMQIGMLQDKENALANRFGYSSLEDFIAGVRDILRSSAGDMKALQQFSSTNLRKHLKRFKHLNESLLVNQRVDVRCTTDSTKLKNLFDMSGGNGDITWKMDGPDQIFSLTWDIDKIKRIINVAAGQQLKRSSTNLEQTWNVLNNASDLVKITMEGSDKTVQQFVAEGKTSPFSLTPTELKELQKTNPEVLTQLQTRINDFIYNELCAGASPEFKSAVESVLGAKIQSQLDLTFFMGGDNWINSTVGAMGELQTAIFFQFIARKTPNKILATQIARIVGDELNAYGQSLHTDLKIFEALGIQVKNYSDAINKITKQERTVEVRLHPSEVASLGASEGVIDYLVNSYFNTSIPKYPPGELDAFFESHASELLNLDFNPQIPDQVSFYMIGNNFIPGSAVLTQAFQKMTIKVSTSISGKSGGSDASFLPNPKGWHNPFTDWWESTTQPPSKENFSPTAQNNIGAWDRNISIRTKFTYSIFFETGAYQLF